MHSLRRVASQTLWQVEFGFDLGEDFAVFLGLFAGEFAVLSAYGENYILRILRARMHAGKVERSNNNVKIANNPMSFEK